MTTSNPYGAPRASVDNTREQYQPVRIFSTSGRIGRARYIAYGMGLPILIMFVVGLFAAFLGDAGGIVMSLGWIAVGKRRPTRPACSWQCGSCRRSRSSAS